MVFVATVPSGGAYEISSPPVFHEDHILDLAGNACRNVGHGYNDTACQLSIGSAYVLAVQDDYLVQKHLNLAVEVAAGHLREGRPLSAVTLLSRVLEVQDGRAGVVHRNGIIILGRSFQRLNRTEVRRFEEEGISSSSRHRRLHRQSKPSPD